MTRLQRTRKVILLIGALVFGLLLAMPLTGCRGYLYRRANRRIVKVYYRPNGCRVRRVIYPCYSPRGNLKVQKVRCPDGRRWKRRWIHPDGRCSRRGSEYIP